VSKGFDSSVCAWILICTHVDKFDCYDQPSQKECTACESGLTVKTEIRNMNAFLVLALKLLQRLVGEESRP
jgi:hypothetical protein